jgi:hypothetical protein
LPDATLEALETITKANIGALMAYLIPGATVLWGLRPWSPDVDAWFSNSTSSAPTLGGFLYLTVASFAVGMVVSAVRWMTLDMLLRLTGVRTPKLDFSRLADNLPVMELIIENHYQHYLFYSNTLVAVVAVIACHQLAKDVAPASYLSITGAAALLIVLFFASRNTLAKYHARCHQLLGERPRRDDRPGRASNRSSSVTKARSVVSQA